jgi:hypothetical protein
MFAALVISLCLGLLSRPSALIDLSSFLYSLRSGILAFGITVNGAKLSEAIDLMALGDPFIEAPSVMVCVIKGLIFPLKLLLRMLMLKVCVIAIC